MTNLAILLQIVIFSNVHFYEANVHVQGSQNYIDGVIVSILVSCAADCGFKLWASLTKDYTIGVCWCCAQHIALSSKGKEWLANNQNNVSELSNMSTRDLLQWVIWISNSACWASTKRTSSSSHQNITYFCHDVPNKLLVWC